MDKIVKFIQSNKQLVIIIGGISFILIIFIISLFTSNRGSNIALIEQPLFFYQTKKITIPENIYKDFKNNKKKYEIYKVKPDNLNIKVEGIMSLLQINAPEKTVYANIAYTWKNKSGDVVEYDVKNQTVFINLNNTSPIFSELVSPSDSQLEPILQQFVQKYINNKFEYKDIKIERTPSTVKVSGRRYLNGIPLQAPGLEKNYDYVVLDQRNELKSAKVLLAEFEEKPVSKLDIITSKQLSNVIANQNYPKEVNDGILNAQDGPGPIEDPRNMTDDILNGTIPTPTSYKAKDLEIVYFFANVNQQFVTPVYRMNVEGQVVYKGQTYNVEGAVNASAINPDHVYIPSNIVYAD